MSKTVDCLVRALILLLFSFSVHSKEPIDLSPPTPASMETFLRSIKKSYQFTGPDYDQLIAGSGKKKYRSLKKGDLVYLPINWMLPGQGTFAFLSVLKKIQSAPTEWSADWDAQAQEWRLTSDNGKALYPASKSALVILLADSVLVIDGNHKVLTSIYYGSQTIPAKIAKNWSHLTLAEAMPKLVKKDLIFPYNAKGERLSVSQLPDYSTIEDYPLRFLASLVLLKCQVQIDEDQSLKILKIRGSTSPIICKLNRDIPFLELHIARTWQTLGLNYTPNHDITEELLESAREILIQESQKARSKHSFLKSVLLLNSPIQLDSIQQPSEEDITKLEALIRDHLKLDHLNFDQQNFEHLNFDHQSFEHLRQKRSTTCQNLLKDSYF